MVISVAVSQTNKQKSVVLLFGASKESKKYLIIGITGMEVESSLVSGACGGKGSLLYKAHLW